MFIKLDTKQNVKLQNIAMFPGFNCNSNLKSDSFYGQNIGDSLCLLNPAICSDNIYTHLIDNISIKPKQSRRIKNKMRKFSKKNSRKLKK